MANRFQAALYKEVLYLVQQGVLSVEDADIAICYVMGRDFVGGSWGRACNGILAEAPAVFTTTWNTSCRR